MNTQQKKELIPAKSTPINRDQRRPVNPRTVLEDLFELLEDYGPSWYTEEHHNRAVAALLDRAS
jgi:hypothetical protein